MRPIQSYIFFLFESFIILLLSQIAYSKTTIVTVYVSGSNQAVENVKIYSSRGTLLGVSDSMGKAKINVSEFPVLLVKKGFVSLPVYNYHDLNPASLQPMGMELKTVEIKGKINVIDYLIHLRNINYPHFVQKDTTIYYKFNYRLSFPDKKWEENAWGYININRPRFIDSLLARGIQDPLVMNLFFTNAYFIQFHYQNSGNTFPHHKEFEKAKTMPLFVIFNNDFMSPEGYPLWSKLTHHYTFGEKINPISGSKVYGNRQWNFQSGSDKQKTFTAYDKDKTKRLMEKIVFDSAGFLQSVTLFNPDVLLKFAGYTLINNFSKGNNVNTFRTIYRYSKDNAGNLLTRINHLSTFYKKGTTYYRMSFTATIVDSVPKTNCKIPVIQMLGTKKSGYKHGYEIWQLIRHQ